MKFTRYNGVWKDSGDRELPIFPIQNNKLDCNVPLCIAEEAYKEYASQYGTSQSLERLGERGGFGCSEIAILLYERCKRLEQLHKPLKCSNCGGSGVTRGPSDSGYITCDSCNGKGF